MGTPMCVKGSGGGRRGGSGASSSSRSSAGSSGGRGSSASGESAIDSETGDATKIAVFAAFLLLFGTGFWKYRSLRARWVQQRPSPRSSGADRATGVLPREKEDDGRPRLNGKEQRSSHNSAAPAARWAEEARPPGDDGGGPCGPGGRKFPEEESAIPPAGDAVMGGGGEGRPCGAGGQGGNGETQKKKRKPEAAAANFEFDSQRWSPPPSPEIGTDGHGDNLPPEGDWEPPGSVQELWRNPAGYVDKRVPKILNQVDLELGQADAAGEPEALKKQIRRLQLLWHPDKNPESKELATEVFRYIQEEWALPCLGQKSGGG